METLIANSFRGNFNQDHGYPEFATIGISDSECDSFSYNVSNFQITE